MDIKTEKSDVFYNYSRKKVVKPQQSIHNTTTRITTKRKHIPIKHKLNMKNKKIVWKVRILVIR